jgi:hypothetical protein
MTVKRKSISLDMRSFFDVVVKDQLELAQAIALHKVLKGAMGINIEFLRAWAHENITDDIIIHGMQIKKRGAK